MARRNRTLAKLAAFLRKHFHHAATRVGASRFGRENACRKPDGSDTTQQWDVVAITTRERIGALAHHEGRARKSESRRGRPNR